MIMYDISLHHVQIPFTILNTGTNKDIQIELDGIR
jgi:hypothetical protein